MRKFIFAFLVIRLCVALSGCSDKEGIFVISDGSPYNPYIITTPAQLDAMRDNLSASYRLGANIDFTAYLTSGAGFTKWGAEGWKPIGTEDCPFDGGLDGAGYKITGLWINRPSTAYIGLFGCIDNAVIENLGVEMANDKGGIKGNFYVGGVAGRAEVSYIINCYIIGAVSANNGGVGGIAGQVNYLCNITNCYTTGTINANNVIAGGVAGFVSNHSSITNCYSACAINSSAVYIAGIAGLGGVAGVVGYESSITNCVALNPVITTSISQVGRVTGTLDASGTLSNNWARSDMGIDGGAIFPAGNGHDHINGNDCDAIPTSNWWMDTAEWDYTIWLFVDGQFPKLNRYQSRVMECMI